MPGRRSFLSKPFGRKLPIYCSARASIGSQRSGRSFLALPALTGATAAAVLACAALCSGLRRRAQSARSIRRGEQQQEECPVSFVIGRGSATFRALHDHIPFGRTDAPLPFSTAHLQGYFKDWKLTIRHRKRDNVSHRIPSRNIT